MKLPSLTALEVGAVVIGGAAVVYLGYRAVKAAGSAVDAARGLARQAHDAIDPTGAATGVSGASGGGMLSFFTNPLAFGTDTGPAPGTPDDPLASWWHRTFGSSDTTAQPATQQGSGY